MKIVPPDLFAIETIADRLGGFGACPFCAGVTSLGLSEAGRYAPHLRHDLRGRDLPRADAGRR